MGVRRVPGFEDKPLNDLGVSARAYRWLPAGAERFRVHVWVHIRRIIANRGHVYTEARPYRSPTPPSAPSSPSPGATARADERGLVIEVFPTGGMLWHYRYRVNGKPERVTLGRKLFHQYGVDATRGQPGRTKTRDLYSAANLRITDCQPIRLKRKEG